MSPDTGRHGRDGRWIDSPFIWEETAPRSRRPESGGVDPGPGSRRVPAAAGCPDPFDVDRVEPFTADPDPVTGTAGAAGVPRPVPAEAPDDDGRWAEPLAGGTGPADGTEFGSADARRGPEDVAVAGEGWAAYEGQEPDPAVLAGDVDTSLVDPAEMTGLWLTTELGRESPLRFDGEPIEPEEIGVAPEVADRLRDWAAMWERDWDPERGWCPRARIEDYEALGLWLARRVKDAVGATRVTLQPAHLGRCQVTEIEALGVRQPQVVRLHDRPGAAWPVSGAFVTDSGVGSFTSEVNARLEAWARVYQRAHRGAAPKWDDDARAVYLAERDDLAGLIRAELGPDYALEVVKD